MGSSGRGWRNGCNRGGVASRQVRSPGQIGSGLPGAPGSEADWLTNDMTQLQDGAWRHGMGGRPTQRHMGKEDPVRASGRKDQERSRESEDLMCWANRDEGRRATAVRGGVNGMVRERARLMHGTQTRGRGEIRVGDVGLGVLPLTVSLEDLRLLKLEAKVEVIALNVAF